MTLYELIRAVLQMNLDPRLDFGIGAPRMSEAAPPNAEQLLEASKGHLSHMLDIENEEEWQVSAASLIILQEHLES